MRQILEVVKAITRRFLSDYVAKLDNKKTIPALAWLERRGEGREEREAEEETTFTPVKVVNRNSVEEDDDEEESDTEMDNERSLVAADANQSWPDTDEEEDDADIDFEDFSGTDTEDEEGGFELSDTEEEEERDTFEELAIPPDRRASTVSQIPMHPVEHGEPSKLVQPPKAVTETESVREDKKVKQEVAKGAPAVPDCSVEVTPEGGLIRRGPMGEPFIPLIQREVKLQHSQSMCGIR